MAKERETGNVEIAAPFSQRRAEGHKSDPQLHKIKSQNISTDGNNISYLHAK
jgi:hypothetical protein